MKPVRMPLGVLSILLVLLLNLLAASPSLHEYFHADAGKAGHQCAVTLFAHGQVDAPAVDVALPLPATPTEFLPQFSASIPNALVATLPPGRGPPVSCLHS
jgi:hypothetical protein